MRKVKSMLLLTDHETEDVLKENIVRNEILATLAPPLFAALRPHLKLVELRRRAIINEANKPVDAVYFIESGIISRVARTQEDGPVEVAMVGKFGFIGVSVLLGTMTALHRTIVHIPGQALRISATDLQRVIAEHPAIKDHMLRYVQLLMNQKAQVSLCNAKHEIDKRLARWLLLAHERVNRAELPVTHELLATMLGVRRPGVTEALSDLEELGIIARARGVLKVVDEDALKARACECHRIIEDRFATTRAAQHFEHQLAS
jgi:CRP-like cAMP-binding protein